MVLKEGDIVMNAEGIQLLVDCFVILGMGFMMGHDYGVRTTLKKFRNRRHY